MLQHRTLPTARPQQQRLLVLLLVVCLGCASGGVDQDPPPAVEMTPETEDSSADDVTQRVRRTAIEAREAAIGRSPETALVLFEPPPRSDPLEGMDLLEAEELHRSVLDILHAEEVVEVYGRLDGGGWLVLMPAIGIGQLGDLLGFSPLYRSYQIQVAGFSFSCGAFCEGEPDENDAVTHLAAFVRDPAVAMAGGPFAPAPFEKSAGTNPAVVAAGSWGFGHLGYVFLGSSGVEEARSDAAALPGAGDPQWQLEIRELEILAGAICRKTPG